VPSRPSGTRSPPDDEGTKQARASVQSETDVTAGITRSQFLEDPPGLLAHVRLPLRIALGLKPERFADVTEWNHEDRSFNCTVSQKVGSHLDDGRLGVVIDLHKNRDRTLDRVHTPHFRFTPVHTRASRWHARWSRTAWPRLRCCSRLTDGCS